MFDKIYCAPMEGVTRSVFRREHHALFGGCDQYVTPFLAPSADGIFSEKELREVLPQACAGVPTVPQLLAGRAEYFLWAAKLMGELGYTQVDLNLGCPSGTVVAKHKGSGMLADPDGLDRFLHEVFEGLRGEPLQVSVKTRIGLENRCRFRSRPALAWRTRTTGPGCWRFLTGIPSACSPCIPGCGGSFTRASPTGRPFPWLSKTAICPCATTATSSLWKMPGPSRGDSPRWTG